MTTAEHLTSTPGSGPIAPGMPAADRTLTDRCADSGQYLAGLIAAGMLDHVGRPDRLPELLWPDADPELVRAVWEAGLATGYRAGRLAARPEWTVEGLDRLRDALRKVGWEGMGRTVSRTAAVHQPIPKAQDGHERVLDQNCAAARAGGHP